jgi:hypothetical protein
MKEEEKKATYTHASEITIDEKDVNMNPGVEKDIVPKEKENQVTVGQGQVAKLQPEPVEAINEHDVKLEENEKDEGMDI